MFLQYAQMGPQGDPRHPITGRAAAPPVSSRIH
jgi:hypothetical protein